MTVELTINVLLYDTEAVTDEINSLIFKAVQEYMNSPNDSHTSSIK